MNLNELKLPGGSNLRFLEAKVLEDAVDVAGYQVCIKETRRQGNRDTNSISCVPFGTGNFEINNQSPAIDDDGVTLHDAEVYLTYSDQLNPAEAEIILLDDQNRALDYIRYCAQPCSGTAYWQVSSDCGVELSDIGANTQVVARYPEDGTGGWSTNQDPDGPPGPTPGGTNSGSGSGGGPFSIDIDVGGGAASTCVAFSITLTVFDNQGNVQDSYANAVTLTTSTGNGDWTLVSGNGALDNGAADDGVAIYDFVNADNGQVTVALANSRAVDLTVSASGPNASGGPSAVVGFRDNAFVVTPLTTSEGVATTVVAGRPHAFEIAAWTKDRDNPLDPASPGTCSVASAYQGVRNLKAWVVTDADDPGGATPRLQYGPGAGDLTGTLPRNAAPGASNLPLTFASGFASVELLTSDVGKYSLAILDDTRTFAAAVDILGSSPLLTVRPLALGLSNIQAGAVANPGGIATDTGNGFTAAGDPFSATVAGYLWSAADDADNDGLADTGADVTDNALTPSYAWDTELSATPDAGTYTPSGGVVGTLSSSGLGVSMVVTQAGFSGGSQSVADLAYDEVGSLQIDALAQDYLNTAGVAITGRSPIVGRFYAHHLALLSASLSPACNGYTYMDEPALGIAFVVEGRNAGDVRTENYFLDPGTPGAGYANVATTLSFVAEDSDAGIDLGPRVSVAGGLDWSAVAPLVPGQGSFNDPMAALLRDSTPDGPYSDLDLGIVLVDPDGAALGGLNMNAMTSGDCAAAGNCSARSIGSTDLRYGRLELRNANGSELVGLTVPAFTSYYNGIGFVPNTDDICTSIAISAIPMTNADEADQRDGNIVVGAGSTSLTVLNTPAANGAIDLQLSAPGAGNTGYVEMTPDLSFATGAGLPWLTFDWDGNPATDDTGPTARATFGVYSGNQRQIYIREMFQ
jgi:MSHA biogenesis protein MshQ